MWYLNPKRVRTCLPRVAVRRTTPICWYWGSRPSAGLSSVEVLAFCRYLMMACLADHLDSTQRAVGSERSTDLRHQRSLYCFPWEAQAVWVAVAAWSFSAPAADFEQLLVEQVLDLTDLAWSASAKTLLASFHAFSAVAASDCRKRRRAGNCAYGWTIDRWFSSQCSLASLSYHYLWRSPHLFIW